MKPPFKRRVKRWIRELQSNPFLWKSIDRSIAWLDQQLARVFVCFFAGALGGGLLSIFL